MTSSSSTRKLSPPGDEEQNRECEAETIDAQLARQMISCSLDEKEIKRIQSASNTNKERLVLWLHQLHKSQEETSMQEDDLKEAGASDHSTGNTTRMKFTRLPSDPSQFISLSVLNLSKNNLEVLPDYFGSLDQLKVLNLSGNALRTLPRSLTCCSSLVELDASFNELEILPRTFGSNLPNMKRLFLQLNRLRLLPAAVCNMNLLVHLEVHFNNLAALPSNIGDLKNLKFLNASGNFNNLTKLPDSLGNATSLEFLDLSYNQITRLPITFGYLMRLQELKMLQNPLVFPPLVVVEHSTKAVVEYMDEQLHRFNMQQVQEVDDLDIVPRGTASCSIGSTNKVMVPCSPRFFFTRPSSWIAEVFGGMCRSSSPVLGGSATKFVGLREQGSSSDLSSD